MIKSVEEVFAAGLNTTKMGKLSASAFWKNNTVIILNSDNTLLLQFSGLAEKAMEEEIKFYIKDYEGMDIKMKGEEVIFKANTKTYSKEKFCKVPETNFDTLNAKFNDKKINKKITKKSPKVRISENILSLLDFSLSHVEIVSDKKELVIVQRDIYTGQRLEIRETATQDIFFKSNSFNLNFKIGIRTKDLESLFLIIPEVTFNFVSAEFTFIENTSHKFKGIIGNCVYDDLGKIGNN